MLKAETRQSLRGTRRRPKRAVGGRVAKKPSGEGNIFQMFRKTFSMPRKVEVEKKRSSVKAENPRFRHSGRKKEDNPMFKTEVGDNYVLSAFVTPKENKMSRRQVRKLNRSSTKNAEILEDPQEKAHIVKSTDAEVKSSIPESRLMICDSKVAENEPKSDQKGSKSAEAENKVEGNEEKKSNRVSQMSCGELLKRSSEILSRQSLEKKLSEMDLDSPQAVNTDLKPFSLFEGLSLDFSVEEEKIDFRSRPIEPEPVHRISQNFQNSPSMVEVEIPKAKIKVSEPRIEPKKPLDAHLESYLEFIRNRSDSEQSQESESDSEDEWVDFVPQMTNLAQVPTEHLLGKSQSQDKLRRSGQIVKSPTCDGCETAVEEHQLLKSDEDSSRFCSECFKIAFDEKAYRRAVVVQKLHNLKQNQRKSNSISKRSDESIDEI